MTKISRRALIAGVGAGLVAGPVIAYPERPIRIIVPTAAGGSTDLVARILQMTIESRTLLAQPTPVVNNAAAAGISGTRQIKDAEPDGHTIGIWHMGLLTSPAMGVVDYDHTSFELIAQVGRIPIGFGVRSDSPFRTIGELIEAARRAPNTLTVATNIGLLPHFVPLMLAHEAGVTFRFVQSGGGALRLRSVQGGHTQASLFSVPEFVTYRENGIRPLVLFAPERSPQLPDVPTTRESGLRTVFEERILVLAPRGTPAERVGVIAAALRTALEDAEVRRRFAEQGIDGVFRSGAELRPILDADMVQIRAVAEEVRRAQQAPRQN